MKTKDRNLSACMTNTVIDNFLINIERVDALARVALCVYIIVMGSVSYLLVNNIREINEIYAHEYTISFVGEEIKGSVAWRNVQCNKHMFAYVNFKNITDKAIEYITVEYKTYRDGEPVSESSVSTTAIEPGDAVHIQIMSPDEFDTIEVQYCGQYY